MLVAKGQTDIRRWRPTTTCYHFHLGDRFVSKRPGFFSPFPGAICIASSTKADITVVGPVGVLATHNATERMRRFKTIPADTNTTSTVSQVTTPGGWETGRGTNHANTNLAAPTRHTNHLYTPEYPYFAERCVALRRSCCPCSFTCYSYPGRQTSNQLKHNMAHSPAPNACFGLHNDGVAMR